MTTPLPIPDGIYDLRLKYGDVIRNVMVRDGVARMFTARPYTDADGRRYFVREAVFLCAGDPHYQFTPVVVPDTIPEK